MKAFFCFYLLLFITNISVCQGLISNEKLSHDPRFGFIENKGQIIDQNNKPNPSVLYLLNTPGMNVQLRKTGFSYDVFSIVGSNFEFKNQHIIVNGNLSPITDFSSETSLRSYKIHRIDFDLVASNPDCEMVTNDPSSDYQNYYTTGTSVEGVTHVRSFKSVTYKNIYPKIDLEFYSGTKSAVKYNFVIHPGGKLSSIKIRISDPEIQISSVGSMLLKTTSGTIEEAVPTSLYSIEGIETPVNVMFAEISQGVYGFLVDKLVPSRATFIIDPVPVRVWGTYYGGTDDDIAFTSVVDNAGCCYIAGRTYSTSNIASSGAYQMIMGGLGDAFFAKFSPSGQRIWATYYGGMASEEFHGMSMTPDVKLILSGITGSPNNISTPGSFQPTLGSFGSSDAFLVNLTLPVPGYGGPIMEEPNLKMVQGVQLMQTATYIFQGPQTHLKTFQLLAVTSLIQDLGMIFFLSSSPLAEIGYGEHITEVNVVIMQVRQIIVRLRGIAVFIFVARHVH